jgi:ferrous iron transport protein A
MLHPIAAAPESDGERCIRGNRRCGCQHLNQPILLRAKKSTMPENLIISTGSTQVENLALLRKGECATVTGLAPVVGAERVALRMRLLELGFAPGEQIRVVAESFPRRDPMAVRVGNTTFALRRHEAAMIQIRRLTEPA